MAERESRKVSVAGIEESANPREDVHVDERERKDGKKSRCRVPVTVPRPTLFRKPERSQEKKQTKGAAGVSRRKKYRLSYTKASRGLRRRRTRRATVTGGGSENRGFPV